MRRICVSEVEAVFVRNFGKCDRAFVLSAFNPGPEVVNDFLNPVPVAIFVESGSHFGIAYQATLNGQALSFSSDGTAISDETGSTWDLNGLAESGPLAGTQLEYVTSFVTEWYGWAAYHPNTTIYGIDDGQKEIKSMSIFEEVVFANFYLPVNHTDSYKIEKSLKFDVGG